MTPSPRDDEPQAADPEPRQQAHGAAAGPAPAHDADASKTGSQRSTDHEDADRRTLLRAGRWAWAVVGLAVVAYLAALLAAQVSLVVVPLVLALFPAALLSPVAEWLKERGTPAALAALLSVMGLLLLLAGVVAGLVPVVAGELPALVESVEEGTEDVERLLRNAPFGPDVSGLDELVDRGVEQLGEAGEMAGGALRAAAAVLEVVAGTLFGLVVLFFYLKDGSSIGAGIRDTLPERMRADAEGTGGRVWYTLGAYFRGQLLVALVDAVLIGIGLVALRVPLALPLAVLVFFGGLFPIIGAFVSGTLAVLVALADSGLTIAIAVLVLIIVVQQVESNVLEPVVLSRAISLHPLMVLTAITTGAVTLGVLGAFLAVPVAAGIGRAIDYLRGRPDPRDEHAGSDDEPPPAADAGDRVADAHTGASAV
jgi:predicted PurR-regulated permease PerM